MPLETLNELDIKGMVIDKPRRKSERFNPFTDLTREDFEKKLELIQAIIEFEGKGLTDLGDAASGFNELRVLFPNLAPQTIGVSSERMDDEMRRLTNYYYDGDWGNYLRQALRLKFLEPEVAIQLTNTALENLKMRIQQRWDVGGSFSGLSDAYLFRQIWPGRFHELELTEEYWIKLRDAYQRRAFGGVTLAEARIVFPEQFKRDIKVTDDVINFTRRSGGDYYAAILAADDIIVDNTGLHLVFNEKETLVEDHTPPAKLNF